MESESGELPELLPFTQRLVKETEQLTGHAIDIVADPSIRRSARAVYYPGRPDGRDRIVYDPAKDMYLDHLIAHEIGHVRMHHASPEEPYLFVTANNRGKALEDLRHDIRQAGIKAPEVPDKLKLWTSALRSKIQDWPEDIVIETWIAQNYPDLRRHQAQSLISQARTLATIFNSYNKEHLPRLVWEYACALDLAYMNLVNERVMPITRALRPVGDDYAGLAGQLVQSFERENPSNLLASRKVSKAWIEELVVDDWFTWQRITEPVPRAGDAAPASSD